MCQGRRKSRGMVSLDRRESEVAQWYTGKRCVVALRGSGNTHQGKRWPVTWSSGGHQLRLPMPEPSLMKRRTVACPEIRAMATRWPVSVPDIFACRYMQFTFTHHLGPALPGLTRLVVRVTGPSIARHRPTGLRVRVVCIFVDVEISASGVTLARSENISFLVLHFWQWHVAYPVA